jgi:hypothetical protein
MSDIGEWLGLGQYVEAFEAEKIDLEALPGITPHRRPRPRRGRPVMCQR